MRSRKKQSAPVDVSKGLFMDLAFLLIAVLVLLVREPEEETAESQALASPPLALRVPSEYARHVLVDATMQGTSVQVAVHADGTIDEIGANNSRTPLASGDIEKRLNDLKDGPVVVVLQIDKGAPYEAVAAVRDAVAVAQTQSPEISIVEMVSPDGKQT